MVYEGKNSRDGLSRAYGLSAACGLGPGTRRTELEC